MKNKKKTARIKPTHILSVGPITSREKSVQRESAYNIRSMLNIKIKQCIKRRDNAQREMKAYVAALNALIRERGNEL